MSSDTFNVQSIDDLRAELKRWEKDFASTHDGHKPSREDIKGNGEIAARYSLFNRLTRPQTTTKNVAVTPQKRVRRIRPALEEQCSNVPRQSAVAATPRKGRHAALEPSQQQHEVEATPAHIRCALGPTPQKDGFVLGIFDLKTDTPSQHTEKRTSDHEAMSGTPSKGRMPSGSDQHIAASAQSESKRFYLDAFSGTPMKRKREEDHQTPSTAKRQFATPAFLRRESTLDAIQEDVHGEGQATFASKRPGRRKGMARSFSAILANLRKTEDERMDDEWDILRELEAEGAGDEPHQPLTAKPPTSANIEAVEIPLGPDQAPVSTDDDAEEATEPGRKPWKKKGLKRQTKQVKMKPVLHAPQRAADAPEQPDARQEDDVGEKDSGTVRKAVRKVSEAAHMNFRRLKIKNKNSKAKGKTGRKR